MACGGCMAKAQRKAQKFEWTGPNGEKMTFSSEIEAKAKKMRAGGNYKAVSK